MTEYEQVLAFRLYSQHLAERFQPGSLLRAAGACGIQNTPPGSAALSLHARVASLVSENIQNSLSEEKSLLQAWSMRGAPYLFPTRDRHTFTLGLLPVEEAEIRAFIPGVVTAIEKVSISAVEVVELTSKGLLEALDRREQTKDELGRGLGWWVSQKLTFSQQAAWAEPSWYAQGQTLGESIIRFFLPVMALKGLCCHTGRRMNKAYLGRLDQWLGIDQVETTGEAARAELARRYLHAYGPSTPTHFAEWAGISPTQAAVSWGLIQDELVEIYLEKRKTWLLQKDIFAFRSPPKPEGVHFLPPHDPYLQIRDREVLVSDKGMQQRIWRNAGSPGVLLADGRCIATWRSSKKSNRLTLTIEPFIPLSQRIRQKIELEAGPLSQYWNCTKVEVRFVDVD